jgi:hypothetical protein
MGEAMRGGHFPAWIVLPGRGTCRRCDRSLLTVAVAVTEQRRFHCAEMAAPGSCLPTHCRPSPLSPPSWNRKIDLLLRAQLVGHFAHSRRDQDSSRAISTPA